MVKYYRKGTCLKTHIPNNNTYLTPSYILVHDIRENKYKAVILNQNLV